MMILRDLIINSLLLLLPLVFSGVFHMVCVRIDLFPFLKIPLSEAYFGPSKTYRGLILMVLLTMVGVLFTSFFITQLVSLGYLKSPHYFESLSFVQNLKIGFFLGLTYILCELPNSFYKRRKGIPPGRLPTKPLQRFIHALLDQADSGFGLVLVYGLFFSLQVVSLLFLFLFGTFLHLFFNILLYLLKLRKEPL